jgi:Trk K+ transport system NAD-binding subunit
LIIAVSAIGLQLGSIDSATNSAIILVAIVTSTVSPLLFNRILPQTPALRRRFVIVGAGRMPRLLARRILGHSEEVIFVDYDESRAPQVEEMGIPMLQADPLDPDTWERLQPETIRAVAVLLPDDEANLKVSRLVHAEYGIRRVVSRVQDAMRASEFTEMGVQVINPTLSPVVELEYLLLFPTVTSLMTDLEDDHDIAEVRLGCPELVGKPLRDLGLPSRATIVLVRRNGEVIYPRGDTQLETGDRVTIMGSLNAVRDLVRRCE